MNRAAASGRLGATEPDGWLQPIRWVALAVWLSLPFLGAFGQPYAGRVIWTIAIAALPVFIVLIGYHRWRRLCPLAFVNQIPVRLRRAGSRKLSGWMETNYHYVPFTVLLVSLWIRLVATNGDGIALTVFFTLVSITALVVGALFTGKTWCNYLCPISFVEKVYTEPNGLRETGNSQCAKCTACKSACPDINEENGYWKELDWPAKRYVYFAYPGLILAFYGYFFLQSGTWDYYYSGRWTDEPGVIWTAFMPGHDAVTAGLFFLPEIPRALAAAVTLVGGALLSAWLFSRAEPLVRRWLQRREPNAFDETRVRHLMLSVAAFLAFVSFYSFAGQPTLRRVGWIPQYAAILLIAIGTLILVRKVIRTQKAFAEQSLARNILKRWEWGDIAPPEDLHDAYVIHTARSNERERGYQHLLAAYQEAVRETVACGLLTTADVQRLDALRSQLQIKPADHERIMTALAEEKRAILTDPSLQLSVEKALQRETYARALEHYLERLAPTEGAPSDALIEQLRQEYGVSRDEHNSILAEILGHAPWATGQISEALRVVERSAATMEALDPDASPTDAFLVSLLSSLRHRAVDRLLRALDIPGASDASRSTATGLCSNDRAARSAAFRMLVAQVVPAVGETLVAAQRDASNAESAVLTLGERLRAYTHSADPYLRATSLYALEQRGGDTASELERLAADEHGLVSETALGLRARGAAGRAASGLIPGALTIEKMVALHPVPMFKSLSPESLARLAQGGADAAHGPGEILCREGEPGDRVLVILSGEVEVYRSDAGSQAVARIGPGGVVGEMAALDPAPRSATVVAGEEGAQVLWVGADAFTGVLQTDSEVAAGVIRTLVRRLRGHDRPSAAVSGLWPAVAGAPTQ